MVEFLGKLSNIDEWCTRTNENGLSCIFLNIRAVKKNLEQFKGYLKKVIEEIDVICLCEVNISKRRLKKGLVCMEWFHMNGFTVEKKIREQKKGGGLFMYIREELRYKVNIIETNFCENLAITLETGRGQIEIVLIYRPPKKSKQEFFKEFKEKVLVDKKGKSVIIMGDFNLKFMNRNLDETEFFDNVASAGLDIGVEGFTREVIEKTKQGTLKLKQSSPDNMLIGLNKEYCSKTAIIENKISDHYMLSCKVMEERAELREKPNEKIEKIDAKKLNEELQKIDWIELSERKSVTEMYEGMKEVIQLAYDKAKKKVKAKNERKKEDNPWITNEIIEKMKKRDALFRKWKKWLYSEYYREQYNKLRNEVNHDIKKAKDKYYKGKLQQGKNDGRKTWKVINEIVGRKSKTDIDQTIHTNFIKNGKSVESVVNEMATEFSEEIKRLKHTCDKTLSEETKEEVKMSARIGKPTMSEVEKLLDSMDGKKGAGIDGIRMKDLKACNPDIVIFLRNFIHLSLETASIPKDLKKAIIRPIFKGGEKEAYSNYRPISILSSLHKITEKYVASVLTKYLSENELINKQQFGFQKGKNTAQLLGKFCNETYEAMDKGQYSLCLFVDFKKAFDTLPHAQILKSLEKIGVRGTLYEWIKEYLRERSYAVKVNKEISEEMCVESGVPQGSYLGPLLYIIFTNSLANLLTKKRVQFYMYADDTAVVVRGLSAAVTYKKMQQVITLLQKWAHDNSIVINKKKTCQMMIKHYKKKVRGAFDDLVFHDLDCLHSMSDQAAREKCKCKEEVVKEKCVKYLGVLIDERMGWERQVKNVCDKLRRCLVAVSRMGGKASPKIKKLVYQSLGESHVNYAIAAWGNCTKKLRTKINTLQWRIIKKFAPTRLQSKARKELGLLTIEARYVHQLIVDNYWSKEFREVSGTRHSIRLIKGDKKRNMRRKIIRTMYGEKMHGQVVPKIWESLPDEMLGYTNYFQIKNNFAKWLLKKEGKQLIANVFKK